VHSYLANQGFQILMILFKTTKGIIVLCAVPEPVLATLIPPALAAATLILAEPVALPYAEPLVFGTLVPDPDAAPMV
jgi:hypothetical protein